MYKRSFLANVVQDPTGKTHEQNNVEISRCPLNKSIPPLQEQKRQSVAHCTADRANVESIGVKVEDTPRNANQTSDTKNQYAHIPVIPRPKVTEMVEVADFRAAGVKKKDFDSGLSQSEYSKERLRTKRVAKRPKEFGRLFQ